MRRITYVALVLLAIFLLNVNLASALTVSVELSKEVIDPNGVTTISVISDEPGVGYIKVTMPNNNWQKIDITLEKNKLYSFDYPNNFPGGSTEELGDYEVEIYVESVGGKRVNKAMFWVGFTVVIPEYPFGTLTALLITFVAVATLKIKRFKPL